MVNTTTPIPTAPTPIQGFLLGSHHERRLDFCHQILNFAIITVPHFCLERELHPFHCIVPQENGRKIAPFVKRVPTLLISRTCYFAAHDILRSPGPICEQMHPFGWQPTLHGVSE